MIKEKKEKSDKIKRAHGVQTPEPPQSMNPIKPAQENSGNEKEQRPGDLRPQPTKKKEKPKLLGDPIEIDDETTI